MTPPRRRTVARPESHYRTRATNGAAYFTSRRAYDDLTIMVKRYPGPATAGPDFVLVHGLGVSSRYFQPLAAELAKTGRVWLIDLPGYGAAPNPRRAVSLEDHALVVARFIEDADLAHPVLVGHSMGAQVITCLAVGSPEVTEHLVLLAPTMPPDARGFWRGLGRLLHDGLRESWAVRGIAVGDYLVRCGPPYLIRQTRVMLEDRPEDRMPQLRHRTLVVTGDHDPIATPDWGRELAGSTARAAVVPGPHVVMHSAPHATARLIVEHSHS